MVKRRSKVKTILFLFFRFFQQIIFSQSRDNLYCNGGCVLWSPFSQLWNKQKLKANWIKKRKKSRAKELMKKRISLKKLRRQKNKQKLTSQVGEYIIKMTNDKIINYKSKVIFGKSLWPSFILSSYLFLLYIIFWWQYFRQLILVLV